MRANRGRDTGPELALRRAVHARGLRYFVNRRPVKTLRRTADMVFPAAHLAVFLDGCFWHGCPDHHTVAKTNAHYWAEKAKSNQDRDVDTDSLLAAAGWTVLRIWEHVPTDQAAALVQEALTRCRSRQMQQRPAVTRGPGSAASRSLTRGSAP